MEAFEKGFDEGPHSSNLYHVAKYWYKRGMLHAAEMLDNCNDRECPDNGDLCTRCHMAAIRKEAGE